MLLAKSKLSTIEVLIFRASIESYINHDEIISGMTVAREYNDMQQEIIDLKMLWNLIHKHNGDVMCQL